MPLLQSHTLKGSASVASCQRPLQLQLLTPGCLHPPWRIDPWPCPHPSRLHVKAGRQQVLLVHVRRPGVGQADGRPQDVVRDVEGADQGHRHPPQVTAQAHDEALDGLGLGGCNVLLVPEEHVSLDAGQGVEVGHGLEGAAAVGVDAALHGPLEALVDDALHVGVGQVQHVVQALVPGVEGAQLGGVLAQPHAQREQHARSPVLKCLGQEGGVPQVPHVSLVRH
mmetsp:Transcript_5358/g.11748  ORF Transcript_5358/g.11748 Transcript_5358/m.11748 type:complete len:224 (-) Transcript_5358:1632-2303(-)